MALMPVESGELNMYDTIVCRYHLGDFFSDFLHSSEQSNTAYSTSKAHQADSCSTFKCVTS